MSVLVWVKDKEAFLLIQEGTGDALSHEERERGFCDYLNYSLFHLGELDLDEDWSPEFHDGGCCLFQSPTSPLEGLPEVYTHAFNEPWSPEKTILIRAQRAVGKRG